mgnify:CR=1 FL=1
MDGRREEWGEREDRRDTTLTDALSNTLIVSLSAMPCFTSSFSRLHRGRSGHLPKTTRSISLWESLRPVNNGVSRDRESGQPKLV